MSKEGGRFGLFEPKREPPGSKRVVNCANKLMSSKQASKFSRQGTRWSVVTFNFLIASSVLCCKNPTVQMTSLRSDLRDQPLVLARAASHERPERLHDFSSQGVRSPDSINQQSCSIMRFVQRASVKPF